MPSNALSGPRQARRIYLAGSWRSAARLWALDQQLRAAGHEVDLFCRPGPDQREPFSWAQVASDWESWSIPQFLEGLAHPSAREAFARDFSAMTWADTLLAVAPMGVSSALELGWGIGRGKDIYVLLDAAQRPDLMLSLVPVDHLFETRAALLEALEAPIPARWGRRPDDPAFEDGLAATLRSLNDSSQCPDEDWRPGGAA